jgi:hypothetical protein
LQQTAPAKPKRSHAKSGFVYVIGMEEDATAVKTGFAPKVDDRRSTLETSSHHTLKVLVTLKGSPATEKDCIASSQPITFAANGFVRVRRLKRL